MIIPYNGRTNAEKNVQIEHKKMYSDERKEISEES